MPFERSDVAACGRFADLPVVRREKLSGGTCLSDSMLRGFVTIDSELTSTSCFLSLFIGHIRGGRTSALFVVRVTSYSPSFSVTPRGCHPEMSMDIHMNLFLNSWQNAAKAILFWFCSIVTSAIQLDS